MTTLRGFAVRCGILFSLLPPALMAGTPEITITETVRPFRTYPFGDPDPVPRMGPIYPYFRFNGYTDVPEERPWRLITLENPYIRVHVAPEIGGKILGAEEKSTGHDFLYFNRVVKFREIAMRGPWTSGGVEFNFGEIGHAPSTSSPVDYCTRMNPDSSVSCWVGAMDLASRTEWRVEIRLPADRASVETRSYWYNPGDLPTTRYHWMNAAADAADDLTFIYPGSAFIGHDGELFPWPIDSAGRDLSRYRENAFGSYKSYHVLGRRTDFFGARWGAKDFGVLHWSPYTDKPGKKIWIWGLSREGEIWRDLLTDPELGNGQYVELQSGIHFNQAAPRSSFTPFKHMVFQPSAAERFTEYWFPFKGLQNVVAANPEGVLDVRHTGSALGVRFCPIGPVTDTLEVISGGRRVHTAALRLHPLEVFAATIPLPDPSAPYEVRIGTLLSYTHDGRPERPLERPLSAGPFDWSGAHGLAVQAQERARQRDYDGARELYRRSLESDPGFLPSLVGLAELALRRLDTEEALALTRRALAIDTYDPGANYYYGLAQRHRGSHADAVDGFGVAARDHGLRAASLIQLGEMDLAQGRPGDASRRAADALDADRTAMRALRLLAVARRVIGDREGAARARHHMEDLDPLSHFLRWERVVAGETDAATFRAGIRNEFPHESCLEIAAAYRAFGREEDALAVLRAAPDHPMVLLWRAWLLERAGNGADARAEIAAALAMPSAFVLPYRTEDEDVLRRALALSPHWKLRLYLALLQWSRGRNDRAAPLFTACGNEPDEPSFYLARAAFLKSGPEAEQDLRTVMRLAPGEWRAHQMLVEMLATRGAAREARTVAAAAAERFRASYVLQLTHARTLLLDGDPHAARRILDTLTILPFEGARYGRDTHRFASVMCALDAIGKKDWRTARTHLRTARAWPERLGSGKPYDPDERLEDLIEAQVDRESGEHTNAGTLMRRIFEFTRRNAAIGGPGDLIGANALRINGEIGKARALLHAWRERKPDDPAAQWAWLVFEGRAAEAERVAGGINPWTGDPELVMTLQALRALGAL